MKSWIMAAAVLGAVAGGTMVAAYGLDTTGDSVALLGSDGLFDVTQDVILACGGSLGFGSDFGGRNITYLGYGTGEGAGMQLIGAQKLAPASRAYTSSEYCGVMAPTDPQATESLLVGLDGLAIVANRTTSCSLATSNGFGNTVTLVVTDNGLPGGPPPAKCPGCVSGMMYTMADSFDALRLLYFGLHKNGVYDCASPVRLSLARQWRNLFASDCSAGDGTCAGGLTHAWRLGDLAGSSKDLVYILDPPLRGGAGVKVGIGSPIAGLPNGGPQINPFCNSRDANTTPDVSIVGSLGGPGDFEDLDPIRTTCTPTATQAEDGVCGPDQLIHPGANNQGDLGLVLPVVFPNSPSTLAQDLYPVTPCSTSCVPVPIIKGTLIPNSFRCPDGAPPALGACYQPYAGPSNAPDPRCVSNNLTKCISAQGKVDGRAYNLPLIVSSSQVPVAFLGGGLYQYGLDALGRIYDHTFFRIHSNHASSHNVPDPSVGQTGLCREVSDTSQIGCLVDSDPCSVGVAGRAAAQSFPGLGGSPPVPQPALTKALAVEGVVPFGATPATIDLPVQNLLTGAAPVYPLAWRQLVTTLYGFGNLIGGERELADCYSNNAIVGPAIAGRLVAVPGGVQCLDYPEESTNTTRPLPNSVGPASPFPGCNLGLLPHNACVDPATAPHIH